MADNFDQEDAGFKKFVVKYHGLRMQQLKQEQELEEQKKKEINEASPLITGTDAIIKTHVLDNKSDEDILKERETVADGDLIRFDKLKKIHPDILSGKTKLTKNELESLYKSEYKQYIDKDDEILQLPQYREYFKKKNETWLSKKIESVTDDIKDTPVLGTVYKIVTNSPERIGKIAASVLNGQGGEVDELPSTGNKTADFVTSAIGIMGGYLSNPGGGGVSLGNFGNTAYKSISKGLVTKGVSSVAKPSTVQKIGKYALEGAGTTAPISFVESARQGKTDESATKKLIQDTAIGAGVSLGIRGAGKIVGKGIKSFKSKGVANEELAAVTGNQPKISENTDYYRPLNEQIDIPKPASRANIVSEDAGKLNSSTVIERTNKSPGRYQQHTPEIADKLKRVDDEYKQFVAGEKKYTADIELRNKKIKAEGMRTAAKKRLIIQNESHSATDEGLTQKELLNKKHKETTNYIGKKVVTPDGDGEIVGNVYGKTTVKLKDGTEKSYISKTIEPKGVPYMDVEPVARSNKEKAINEYVKKFGHKMETEVPKNPVAENKTGNKNIYKYETDMSEETIRSKEAFDKHYKLDSNVAKSDQKEIIGKITSDIGKRIISKSGKSTIEDIAGHYKSKYNLPYDFKIQKSLRGENSMARIRIPKEGNEVVIKINPNKPIEQQVGSLRHEIEHLIDYNKTGKTYPDLKGRVSGTFREAYGGKGHHEQYEYFEPDYLRRAMEKDLDRGVLTAKSKSAPITPPETEKIKSSGIPERPANMPPNSISNTTAGTSEKGISKFAETVRQSKNTSDDLKNIIPKSEYEIAKDKDYLDKAINTVKKDFEGTYSKLMSKNPKDIFNGNEVTEAQVIIRKLQNENRFGEAALVIDRLSSSGTDAGKAIQKLTLYNKMTPEGTLMEYRRELKKVKESFYGDKHKVIDNEIDTLRKTISNLERNATTAKGKQLKKINDDIELNSKILQTKIDKLPARFRKLNLTPVEEAHILERRARINEMPDGDGKDWALAELNKTITDRVPSSLGKKISTIQTMSHLLNFRTFGRNTLGNSGFNVLENISETLGTSLDSAISLKTGKRTTFMPDLKGQAKAFIKEGKQAAKEVKAGVNVKDIGTQYELAGTTFKKGFFSKLEKILGYELRVPDRAFYGAAYQKSLLRQMKSMGVAEPTPDMHLAAHLDGLYSTFQDANKISDSFVKLKKIMNAGKDFGAGDIVLKYPKTPGNLIARSIDYSPLNIIRTTYKLASNAYKGNSFNQREFVINMSRGIVGTSMFAVGGLLAKTGIIKGIENKDTKVDDYLEQVGEGKYTINTSALKRFVLSGLDVDQAKARNNDYVVTYDWVQPMAGTISAGANVAKQMKERKRVNPLDTLGIALSSLEGTITTLAEQPLISGIANLGKYGISEGLARTAQNAPSGFIPSALYQTRQLTDNQRRTTKGETWDETMLNSIVNRIPVLSKNLPERVSTKGEKEKFTNATGAEKVFNILLNPSNVKKYSKGENDDILLELYKSIGETKQLPRVAAKKYVFYNDKDEKVSYTLTAKEQSELQEYVGKKSVQYFKDELKFYDKEEFKEYDEEEQVLILGKIYDSIGKEAKDWMHEKVKSKINDKEVR